MDLLPEHTKDESQANMPEPVPEPKPVAKPASPKAFDVFSPGKSTPPASSRPIIVSHKSMAQDTTVTGKKETLPSTPGSTEPQDAPPKEEPRKFLDVHKKITLKPFSSSEDTAPERQEENHPIVPPVKHQEPEPAVKISETIPDNPPTNIQETKFGNEATTQQKPAEHHAVQLDDHETEHEDTEKEDLTPQQLDPSPAFSPPEHNDIAPVTESHEEELLLPAHTGEGYNEPVQSSNEEFNQFVVHHHKTARQKWLKKFGIFFAIGLIAVIAIVIAIWKM